MTSSEELMEILGVSKTVYALYYPETRRIIQRFTKNFPHEMYEEPWTKKQDEYHLPFINGWREWASPIVQFPDFEFAYPANGSSEAIREAIALHASQGKRTIHIFHSEYEGYEALAAGYGLSVIKHNRNDWTKTKHCFGDKDEKFFISQPSAIDGNVWDRYDEWMLWMMENAPNVDILLDLCYIGCVPIKHSVKADYPNISTIFFSLSKSFGVYYHRIGGVYSRDEIPGLWGNKWFKNIASLEIGRMLIEKYGPYDLPKKYRATKNRVIDELNTHPIFDPDQPALDAGGVHTWSTDRGALQHSDVILLAHNTGTNDFSQFIKRDPRSDNVRWCLTPALTRKINEKHS